MKKSASAPVTLIKSLNVLLYTLIFACAANAATATLTITATATITPTYNIAVSSVWRVNAGGDVYPDSWGNTWIADTNYSGGYGHGVTVAVANTADSILYQDERYGNPFTYTFNVPPGDYQVTLKFAELYWEAAGDRIFDVFINSTRVLDDFDIYNEAGSAFRALSKTFNNISPAAGQILIQFGPASIDNAQVCAVQINPMPPTPTCTRTPCSTPVVLPYLQVNGGTWQQTDTVTVNQGAVVNLGPQPLTGGTWSWTGPSGFTSLSRELSAIPLTPGLNTFSAVYTDDCGSQANQNYYITMSASLTATAGCARGITIDGLMNESSWASAQEYQVSELCLGTNPNNISGSFKTLWDNDNLYVGIDVNDSYLNATQVACANYNDSAVEIYLDMANDHGSQPYPGSVGDFHFMISYDSLQFCLNATVALPPGGLVYKSTYDAAGYIMEVMIPWSTLGVVPVTGNFYQFDVQIDFNNGTTERVGQLVWNGDEDNWESSANLGDIMLGFCPSPTATATPVPPALKESFHVFPNPVDPKQSPAVISYHLKNDAEVSIKIFTVTGKHVKTILDKTVKSAGRHSEDEWDGTNENKIEVLSGVYLCVLEVKDKATGSTTKLVKKMAVLR
ncbi:MAG: hypothetical protein JXR81_05440 [Candidatus Goldbacteria bacterium]|nr:hypothetical protein [Candidatus Goldiibacteriota bacterium]